MSYKYFNVQNEHTKRQYQVRRIVEPYWRCDNPNCVMGGNMGTDTWIKNQTVISILSKSEKQISTNCVEETIIKIKTKLVSKNDTAKCSHCDIGIIKFIGYKIMVDDITDTKVTNLSGFGIQQGTKFVESFCVSKLSEVKLRFWAKVNEYKTRKFL